MAALWATLIGLISIRHAIRQFDVLTNFFVWFLLGRHGQLATRFRNLEGHLFDRCTRAHLGTPSSAVKRDAPSFLEQIQNIVVTMDGEERPETLPVNTCTKIIELFSLNN